MEEDEGGLGWGVGAGGGRMRDVYLSSRFWLAGEDAHSTQTTYYGFRCQLESVLLVGPVGAVAMETREEVPPPHTHTH